VRVVVPLGVGRLLVRISVLGRHVDCDCVVHGMSSSWLIFCWVW
jgi:hypothetical protein